MVKVFNYETGKMLAHLRTHADSVEGVQFAEKSVPSPNSDGICANGCAKARGGEESRRETVAICLRSLWRVLNGSARSRRLAGVDLCVSLRLKLVASCSVDGKIKVW